MALTFEELLREGSQSLAQQRYGDLAGLLQALEEDVVDWSAADQVRAHRIVVQWQGQVDSLRQEYRDQLVALRSQRRAIDAYHTHAG